MRKVRKVRGVQWVRKVRGGAIGAKGEGRQRAIEIKQKLHEIVACELGRDALELERRDYVPSRPSSPSRPSRLSSP